MPLIFRWKIIFIVSYQTMKTVVVIINIKITIIIIIVN